MEGITRSVLLIIFRSLISDGQVTATYGPRQEHFTRADGSTYTITAHLKKVEWQNKKVEKRYGYV